jgi:hypothetical protein
VTNSLTAFAGFNGPAAVAHDDRSALPNNAIGNGSLFAAQRALHYRSKITAQ